MARRGKPKRRAGFGYIAILLVLLIIFAAAAVFISKRFAPSKAQVDLQEYYNLSAYESIERPAAGNNELAVVINDEILDSEDGTYYRAIRDGNNIYVGIELAQEYIDNRFYLDKNEGFVIFTDALDSYKTQLDSTVLNYAGEDHDEGYVIAKTVGENVYISMDFVKDHASVSYSVEEDPARVIIRSVEGTVIYRTATADIRMRESTSKKSDIVTVIPKDSRIRILSTQEEWLQVADDSGHIGFIADKYLSDPVEETLDFGHTEPEYTHITLDEKINLVWHGIYYYDSNYYLSDYTYNMTGVNVLAPTWFMFSDIYGNILSYANQDYMDYAHGQGWQVWAVLEDLDGESGAEVVPYTSRRQAAISQIIDQCLYYGIDGINIDLEKITQSIGGDFIQFVREMSVACRNNNIILSVADYAPYSYNAYRHTDEQSRICDYVAIMAYDDYVGGEEAGPNAGLPFLREVMGLCEETVDMSRLIIGVPFYTRLWYENSDGTLSTDTCAMGDVENLTWNYGLTFEWLSDVGYDYGEYDTDGSKVRVWYENAKSLQAKMDILSQYDIAGIGGWRLGQETNDIWQVLESFK